MTIFSRRERPDEAAAFDAFVAASSVALFRSAYLLVADRQLAEDLMQSTLVRVAVRWSAARAAPEAYARQTLVNLSRDQHRRSVRRVTEVSLGETESGASDDHTARVGGRDELMAALAQLPPRQREVLVLRFYGDLSVADTAAATGASEGTVKAYTSRALARMRELLGETAEVSDERR